MILSSFLLRLECSIIIRDPATKDVFATIGPKSFDSIAASIFVRGEATVAGRVERVGGATATRCALRVDFQRHLLYCQVAAESVARQLGQHLYEDVVAEGNASFLRTSWRIARFTVTSIYQPKDGSILKTLHEIRQLSGRAWDDVDDPKKYLEEVTGES